MQETGFVFTDDVYIQSSANGPIPYITLGDLTETEIEDVKKYNVFIKIRRK